MKEVPGSLQDVLDLYERWGGQRYDEQVSQLEHALQTAALARAAQADDALVAAALLHDVGHLLELAQGGRPAGVDLHHELRGAAYLAAVLPAAVTAPIALHVGAKRYRCAVDPAYAGGLSAGSVASLERQGGPFTAVDAAAFAALPGAEAAIALRGWDDQAKVLELDVGTLDRHRPLLERLRMAGSAS